MLGNYHIELFTSKTRVAPIKVATYSYSCLSNNSVKQAYSCRTRILFDLVAILVT
jgi:hypothetical protein